MYLSKLRVHGQRYYLRTQGPKGKTTILIAILPRSAGRACFVLWWKHKGLAVPTAWVETLRWKLRVLSSAAAFVAKNPHWQTMPELCVRRAAECHCQAAGFLLHIYLEISLKLNVISSSISEVPMGGAGGGGAPRLSLKWRARTRDQNLVVQKSFC